MPMLRSGTSTQYLEKNTLPGIVTEPLKTETPLPLRDTPLDNMADHQGGPTDMADHHGGPTDKPQQPNMSQIPTDPPAWFVEVRNQLSSISTLNETLTSFVERFNTFATDLSTVKTSVDFASKQAEDASKAAENATKIAESLKQENYKLKQELSTLKARVVHQESHSRRNNLIFNGIPESPKESWEDCEKYVCNIIQREMGIVHGSTMKFERVHRLGQKDSERTRPVIAKFCYFKDRDLVWSNRKKLSKSEVKVSEDFPIEIIEERRTLYPILQAAIASQTVKYASLKYDKLEIDGKIYTSKNLQTLPANLHPANIATKTENGVFLFCSKYSILSNFYSDLPIKINSQVFRSTEQYYQHTKAMHFEDTATARKNLERN